MQTADNTPAARRPARASAKAWLLSAATAAGMPVLVFIANLLLPWAAPGGAYGGMGAMMLLPYLLLAALIFVGLAVTAVALVSRGNGLGCWATLMLLLVTSTLTLAAMILAVG